MPSRHDGVADGLAGVLDEGGPTATREGLAAVRVRRHRLARRRLTALSSVTSAAAVAMAALVVAGFLPPTTPSPAPSSHPPSPLHGVASPASGAAAVPGRATTPGSRWQLLFLERSAGARVRAYAASGEARPTAGAGGGFRTSTSSCSAAERLVVEVSSRRAVGRVVLEAPAAARHGFAAATLQVVGAAEGAPVEVVAARAPVAAVRMTVRFADGRETTVPVHGGFAVALERRGGAVPVGAVVTATARGGAELARRSLQPGRPWVAGCGGR